MGLGKTRALNFDVRHDVCFSSRRSGRMMARLGGFTQIVLEATVPANNLEIFTMKWIKPEAEVVAVTMEVTAYVATL